MEIKKFVVFLRGINVGGHHKVPMKELKKELESLGFRNVITLLNSGNIILEAENYTTKKLEVELTQKLENIFGFSIPVIVCVAEDIIHIWNQKPFKDIEVTKDIRLYVSFLKQKTNIELNLPWAIEDKSYQILEVYKKIVFSVLDISVTKTPKGMEILEKKFGKDITTRNWNTIEKIINKF
jgi:uncharacterized protein (DUF1697 family)